jgi:hypothetical protein
MTTRARPGYSRLRELRSFVAARSRRRTGCRGSPRSMSSARAPRTWTTNRRRSSGSLRRFEAISAARRLR